MNSLLLTALLFVQAPTTRADFTPWVTTRFPNAQFDATVSIVTGLFFALTKGGAKFCRSAGERSVVQSDEQVRL